VLFFWIRVAARARKKPDVALTPGFA